MYVLGVMAQQAGNYLDAASFFDRAIAVKPDYVEAHYNQGIALQEIKEYPRAIASYDRAIGLNPNFAEAHYNRGNVQVLQRQFQAAVDSYDLFIRLRPEFAEAHFNKGNALKDLKQFEAAISSYDHAIRFRPNHAQALFNKSLALLSMGNFKDGWALYEWRWTGSLLKDHKPTFPQPLWLGQEPLAGKRILLIAEQGLGDSIQFCRYAKRVAALGATVILMVPKPLRNLMKTLEGVSQIVSKDDPLPDFDYYCPLMSLPLAFKTNAQTFPVSDKYLSANPDKVAYWKLKLGPRHRPRVGLVWAGGYRQEESSLGTFNHWRNLPFILLAGFNELDMDFFSLQKGEAAESDMALNGYVGWSGPKIIDYTSELFDFEDTAALIENLDLVISVDTAVAHLAAALGKPVWVLNRQVGCWRWLQNRTDSPWYSTVTLYNQATMGEWNEVMQQISQDLQSQARTPFTLDAMPVC